jgi:mRNA interferase MazF
LAATWKTNKAIPLKTARNHIYWADLDPTKGHEQAGLRPVLILSNDIFNQRSGTVIAMSLTSQPQRAGFPLSLELTQPSLPKKSWVKISQIRTLSVQRLSRKIGRAKPEQVDTAIMGLNQILAP